MGRWRSSRSIRMAAPRAHKDKITLPRETVLGAMKRDRLTLVAGFAASGLL